MRCGAKRVLVEGVALGVEAQADEVDGRWGGARRDVLWE